MHNGPMNKYDFPKWIMVFILGLYIVLVLFPSHLNHDVAWILYSSGKMLNGAEFGKDILDITPPLIWWLNWPPALVAKTFNVAPAVSFQVYVLILIGISIMLMKTLHKKFENRQLWAAALAMVLLPGYDFGQREHLMVILVLPYLISAFGSTSQDCRPARIISATLAGIGVCIKPHFLLIPICIEVALAFRARSIRGLFRCETITMGVVGVVYAIAALVYTPAYFNNVVPDALSNYGAYDKPLGLVVISVISKPILSILAVGALIYARTRWGVAAGFLVAAVGAFLVAVAQKKGWNYHVLPISLFLFFAVVFAEKVSKKAPAYFAGLLFASLVVLIPAAANTNDLVSAKGQHSLVSAIASRLESTPDKHTVYAFVTSPRTIWPAVISANALWTGTAASAYLLPASINRPNDAEAVTAAKRQLAEIARILNAEKPSLILINSAKSHLAIDKTDFSHLKHLMAFPEFVKIFEHYREEASIGHFSVFARVP